MSWSSDDTISLSSLGPPLSSRLFLPRQISQFITRASTSIWVRSKMLTHGTRTHEYHTYEREKDGDSFLAFGGRTCRHANWRSIGIEAKSATPGTTAPTLLIDHVLCTSTFCFPNDRSLSFSRSPVAAEPRNSCQLAFVGNLTNNAYGAGA